MSPGLPGTGVGGLFYILSALWMPICEVRRRLRGHATREWHLVARQFAIAVGVVAAMTGVFWALDTAVLLHQIAAHVVGKGYEMWSLRVSALIVTSGVLAAVISTVHLVRLYLGLRTGRRAAG